MTKTALTLDSFGETIRGVASRKQNGRLDIAHRGEKRTFLFYNGKLVDALINEHDLMTDLVNVLRRSYVLQETPPVGATYANLVPYLEANGLTEYESEQRIKFVLEQLVLQRVFELDFDSGYAFDFTTGTVSVERNVSPSLSAGRVLLDLVAMHEDESIFRSQVPPGTYIERGSEDYSGRDIATHILLDALDRPRTAEDLLQFTGLSEYTFRSTLMSLLSNGLAYKQLAEEEVEDDYAIEPEEVAEVESSGTTEQGAEVASGADSSSSIVEALESGSARDPQSEPAKEEPSQKGPTPQKVGLSGPAWITRANTRLLQMTALLALMHQLFIGAVIFCLLRALRFSFW